jgi:flagellar hook-associated protein 3 FlgL
VFRSIKDGNTEFTALHSETNTGTGIIDPGSKTGNYDNGTYAIIFDKKESDNPLEPTTYKVIDSNNQEIIPPGTVYNEGVTIEFNGVKVFVEGEPAAADFFVIRPSENQDVFSTLKSFVSALEEPRGTSDRLAGLHNDINRAILGIDNALGRVLEVRSSIGARLQALDAQESINEDYNLQIKTTLSGIEDLDYAKAVSELNLKLTGLEASQKAFTRVQNVSMFDYI